MTKQYDEPMRVNLHADGLLWLINRVVFHPRGFALAHTPGTDNWSLLGDGTEVWAFPADDDDGCFELATETLARARQIAFEAHGKP